MPKNDCYHSDSESCSYNTVDNSDANASKQFIVPSYNTTNLTITGDLYKYGTTPFRYISVTATTGNVTLSLLTLYLCSC